MPWFTKDTSSLFLLFWLNSPYNPFPLTGILVWTVSTVILCKAFYTWIFLRTQVRCNVMEGIECWYFAYNLNKLCRMPPRLWNLFTGNFQVNVLFLGHNIAKEIKAKKRNIYKSKRTKAKVNTCQVTVGQSSTEN